MTRRAFSLFEVMLALALTGVLVTSIALFVSQLAIGRAFMHTHADREHAVSMVFDAIGDAIQTSIALGADGVSGVRGSALQVSVTSHTTRLQRALGAEPVAVFQPEDTLQVQFSPGAESISISRGEDKASRFSAGVFAMRFQFFDGDSWHEHWDTQSNGALPLAIACEAWFSPWPEGLEPPWFPNEQSTTTPEEADGLFDAPQPDRRRVFLVPDARDDDQGEVFEIEFDSIEANSIESNAP